MALQLELVDQFGFFRSICHLGAFRLNLLGPRLGIWTAATTNTPPSNATSADGGLTCAQRRAPGRDFLFDVPLGLHEYLRACQAQWVS